MTTIPFSSHNKPMNRQFKKLYGLFLKRYVVMVGVFVLAGLLAGCVKKVEGEKREQSYALGHTLGLQIKAVKDHLEMDFVVRGLRDAVEGKNELSGERIAGRLQELNRTRAQIDVQMAAENLKRSMSYIEKVSKNPGIRKIAPGVFIEEKKAAAAKTVVPVNRKAVSISFKAKTADGSVFDQAGDLSTNTPGLTLVLREIAMPGLRMALSQMKPGAEWIIYLAPDQAFGALVRPGVPSQSALSFEVKMFAGPKE